jgi:WD40 repeat protein
MFRKPGWRIPHLVLAVLAAHFFMMAHATEITGLEGSVTAVAYSPDGKTLAAADGGFDLSLWDVASGKLKAKLNGLATGTARVCWSPDGKSIYGTSGNELIAWEVATGKELRRIKGEMTRTAPSLIALSGDGKTIAAAGRGVVKLWKAISGEVLGEYETHPNYAITWVAFSPDGRYVVTTSHDRIAQLTEVDGGAAGSAFTCESKVVAAEFSPDGKILYVADQAPTLHQIDVTAGEDHPALPLSRVPKQIAVSPDGQLVACVGSTVQIWSRVENRWFGKRIEDSAVGPTAVAFSPDGKFLACGDAEGRIHVWTVADVVRPQ